VEEYRNRAKPAIVPFFGVWGAQYFEITTYTTDRKFDLMSLKFTRELAARYWVMDEIFHMYINGFTRYPSQCSVGAQPVIHYIIDSNLQSSCL
jgi:hypothetical protein